MPSVLVHGGAWLDPEGIMSFPGDVDIIMAVDVEPTRKELRKGTKWVYANFFEPVGTRTSNRYCLQYAHKFDLILTLHPEILAASSKAVFFPFGSTWIRPEDRARYGCNKVFEVSMICGGKEWMPGHKIRKDVWAKQAEITTPRMFWRSSQGKPPGFEGNPVLSSTLHEKAVAFRSMFHVVIENSNETNYFSEKLIDCLVTRTVPIYWGCDNIEAFFESRGILRAKNAEEAVALANKVSPELYANMKQYIDRNEKLAQQYARPMAERVQDVIMRHLFEVPA
jgi:hypothetical protein